MTGSEIFKLDVRIRERMLRKGNLSEAEVGKHLESLSDVAAQGEDLVLRQPALQRHDDASNRKSVPPAPRSVPPPASSTAPGAGDAGAENIDDDDWGENP